MRRVLRFDWHAPGALVLGAAAMVLPVAALMMQSSARDDLRTARETQRDLSLAEHAGADAESGLRGYVLADRPEFREPFDSAVARFNESMARLRSNADDIGLPATLVAAVGDTFQAWRTDWAAPQLQLMASGDAQQARDATATGMGKELFDRFRLASVSLAPAMQSAINTREARADRDELFALGLNLTAGLALAGVVLLVSLALAARRRTALALQQAGAVLTAREADLVREREIGAKQGELIAAASHELRNPLTALVMSAEVLAEEAAISGNDDMASLADTVLRQSRRAARLITEMLDYARIEAGKLQVMRTEVDLNSVALDVVEEVRDETPDTDIRIEAGGDGPVLVEGDRARIQMVMRNLLQNAVRYADAPMRVRVERTPAKVRLHVEDSGPGVAPGDRERIFERFERGATAVAEGTGLGLFISQGVARAHGGEIEVQDSPLGGSDFVLTLPRAG